MSRKTDITKLVLTAVGVAGIMAVAVVAPNVIGAFAKLQKRHRKYRQRYYVNRVIKKLIEQKKVEYIKNNQGMICLRLTKIGKDELKKYALDSLTIKKPWRWDGRFRVIIFDIKEFKKQTRNALRKWLEHLGFVRLQNSVWVYPYDCREVIVLLKSHFHVGKEVLYMTVDSIENDKWLRKEFDLRQN
ncbi:MAG: CRISPR-associated endonuclease Cas2 [Candidatus Vogelbacteria bacterium RIFOXYD2_FULL_44_9]|uniref:CRISPR-associated endonuclease Cas2 n=1 Tax=Candidatus Vogelbacteria bacterium RIFOXYD2_FULL_44_9 TaxID=1802441 RepID=A0A1G2QPP7_9BACT|nr:MAG: CRISPR-associated endonuclease Cas2 [Candidatus Vogelbacteria bacterium RIFOXYD2_FULL_44_9]